jgi:NO-binding membrane sensor protein with MHYT domain
MPMQLSYNWLLVLFSYAVSVLGSFTALQLAVAIPLATTQRQKTASVAMAGGAMGLGAIWAMHFIAMLACDNGMQVTYNPSLTALSALVAFASCSGGLMLVGSGRFSWLRLLAAGTCMGLGVGSMHYLGIGAMMMPAAVSYDTGLVITSLIIAIAASMVALWLAFNLRGPWQMIASALVMGVAVCGMHYTGMAAVNFYDNDGQLQDGYAEGLRGANLGLTVFAIVTTLLVVLLVLYYWRQRYRSSISI